MIQKYKQLVEKLQQATDKRAISWEKTSRANEYQTMIGNNSISVQYYEKADFVIDLENKTHVSLLLWKDGTNIDEVRADMGETDYITLQKLYDSARRSCMRVDETLDDILSQLG